MNKKLVICCGPFGDAFQAGTDNEGFGSLLWDLGEGREEKVLVGCDLPEILGCPWCMKKIKWQTITHQEELKGAAEVVLDNEDEDEDEDEDWKVSAY